MSTRGQGRFARARRRWAKGGIALILAGALAGGMTPAAIAVYGGQMAPPDTYRFMAAVVHASNPDAHRGHLCGATVVASTWVMTAAHCVTGLGPGDLDIVVGRRDLSASDGERIDVASILVHPNYGGRRNNDIALVQLATPTAAPPITLATAANASAWTPGTVGTVMGWGLVGPHTGKPTVLREGTMPIVSDAVCATTSTGSKMVADIMLCAGGVGTVDTCRGDSGGPLAVPDGSGGYIQVGVTSQGTSDCGDASAPSIFAEVAAFESWYAPIISGSPPPPPTTTTTTLPPPPTTTTTTVPPPPGYSLAFSGSPDRSNPAALDQATIGGEVYVFLLGDPEGIDRVTFNLSGHQPKTDSAAPFDMFGTSPSGLAYPLKTARMNPGSYSLVATIVFTNGSTASVNAAFTLG